MKRFLYCFTALLFFALPATCLADNPVTVSFSYDENSAYIGQPFTVNYEISGGSGEYTDIFFNASGVTEMCVIDYHQQKLYDSKGSFSFVPACGEYFDFSIICTDATTNKRWQCDCPEKISCLPNPSIPVIFSNLPEECYIDSKFSFSYTINGISSFAEATISYWVFTEDDTYPDKLFEQNLTALNGSASYVPNIGHSLYIAIQGVDKTGNPFYAKTDRISINGVSSLAPVTVEFSYDAKTAHIGQPFTVNYEISGGSGEYTDIFFNASGVTEMCVIDYHQQKLYDSKGSFSFVPACGEYFDFSIICTDATTNKRWQCNCPEIIPCLSNPNIPIIFSHLPEECYTNSEFSFSYTINGISSFAEATISYWVFIEDDTYPDKLFEQNLTTLNGSSSYVPNIGHSLYIAIQGTDKTGLPFYARTDRIPINDSLDLSSCIFLPANLQRIESQAFDSITSTTVYIPENVSFIAEDAFQNSKIDTLLGTSSYAEEYAEMHDLEFIEYTNSK